MKYIKRIFEAFDEVDIMNRFRDDGPLGLTALEMKYMVNMGVWNMENEDGSPIDWDEEHRGAQELIKILDLLSRKPESFRKLVDYLFEKPLLDNNFNFLRFIAPGKMGNDVWMIKVRKSSEKTFYYDIDKIWYRAVEKILNVIHTEILNTKKIMNRINNFED
tara:strand:+ start:42201 stop:42686 length:486 start_codon:yes stop_codon:yes gene_type:complete